jgi:hypothetical protein
LDGGRAIGQFLLGEVERLAQAARLAPQGQTTEE